MIRHSFKKIYYRYRVLTVSYQTLLVLKFSLKDTLRYVIFTKLSNYNEEVFAKFICMRHLIAVSGFQISVKSHYYSISKTFFQWVWSKSFCGSVLVSKKVNKNVKLLIVPIVAPLNKFMKKFHLVTNRLLIGN